MDDSIPKTEMECNYGVEKFQLYFSSVFCHTDSAKPNKKENAVADNVLKKQLECSSEDFLWGVFGRGGKTIWGYAICLSICLDRMYAMEKESFEIAVRAAQAPI